MTAKLVISFDFELGWGVLDDPLWRRREQDGLYQRMRPVLADLFRFLNERELATTWATVSSMTFEDTNDVPVDHLPESYRQHVQEFCRSAAWETRCGTDLLDSWQQQLAPFSELCSHTATHLYAGYEGVTSEQYVKDVELSIERLEQQYGAPIESLIFTRDQDDFRAEVSEKRVMNLRIGPQSYGKASMGKLARMMRGATRFWQAIPASVIRNGEHGECLQSGSLYFNWSGGDFEYLKRQQVRTQASRMLRQMQADGGTYHVWLHPFNLAETPQHQRAFRHFLESAVRLRDAGGLEILTMRDRSRRASS
ncbi:MAG: hypothetical protein GY879_11705 [Planctomycetes bacterium]|nr:hypothetical protein [Planctomycetota bacterium]MCP4860321.1 hypothetical protein [Planctomycetota bacterium]